MNTTVHLFTPLTNEIDSLDNEHSFLQTCYPAFSDEESKGWCATRKPGVFKNEIPQSNSGWGFCSTDISQKECNGAITLDMEDSMPHKMTFMDSQYCLEQLTKNLKVEQPDELDGLREKVKGSETFCVGQVFSHSFETEKFVSVDGSYTNIDTINNNLKVT